MVMPNSLDAAACVRVNRVGTSYLERGAQDGQHKRYTAAGQSKIAPLTLQRQGAVHCLGSNRSHNKLRSSTEESHRRYRSHQAASALRSNTVRSQAVPLCNPLASVVQPFEQLHAD